MKNINDLNKELLELLDDFKRDYYSIDISIIKLEKLLNDFRLISNTNKEMINLLEKEIKKTLNYISYLKVIDKKYSNNMKEIREYESKYLA